MADVRALIRENGQVRNSLDTDTIQIGAVDIGAAGVLSIGTVNATGINIGQVGMTTTFLGNVDVDGILTIVDGGSLIGDGDVTLGGGDGDTITLGGTYATANDIVNIGTSAVGGDTVVNLRTTMGVALDKRITFDRTADSEAAFVFPDTKDAPVGLVAGMGRVNGAGALEWYTGAAWVTTATTGYTLDDAYNASAGAALVTVDAGDVSWNLTGAYSFTVDISSGSTGTGDGFHVEEGTDYFRLNHSAAGEIAWTADLGAVTVAASKGATFDFNNGFSIDGSGSASNLSSTSDNLTISTITSGTLALTSAALLTLSDGYKAGSSYATDLVLSDSSAEWSAFDTAFGEVSVLSALTALKDGNAATVTVAAEAADTTCFPVFVTAATGTLGPKSNANLTFNSNTGLLGAASMNVATGGTYQINSLVVAGYPSGATNTWRGLGGGNASITGNNSLILGTSAGNATTTAVNMVLLGMQSGKDITDTNASHCTAVGANSWRFLTTGQYSTAVGSLAGAYYGSGTDPIVSATQSTFVGAYTRASASGNTNEIVIGYGAIGAGSNTATLGNTSITSTVLRGAVSGPTSITATTAGTAKSITDVLTINNSAHAADMDGTGSGILFNLTEDTTEGLVDAGRIVVAAEQDLTSTAASQDSYMAFYTSLDGTNAEKARITSDGKFGINTTAPVYDVQIGAAASANRTLAVMGSSTAQMLMQCLSTGATLTIADSASGNTYYAISTSLGGSESEAFRINSAKNIGFNGLTAWGTSAAGVLGLASGTAPTTSPADAVQMWSADFNAAAGKSALHLRDESGILSVFGNNWGLFTAGAEVIDASAVRNIFLENGTSPSAHTDNGIYIYSLDCGSYGTADNLASLALYTESAVVTDTKTSDTALAVMINGHAYWLLLVDREVA